MDLELITIGTELLLGFTIDTNAAEMGQALARSGVRVVRRSTVGDDPARIRAAVTEALDRTGLVITTGGLGPTKDDMTKQVVADLFAAPLETDAAYLAQLEARWARLGRTGPMPEANHTQALVPRGATMLPNPRGTAPGLWMEQGRRTIVLLPGVPREMNGLLHEQVIPRLRQRAGAAGAITKSFTLRCTGIAESALADRIGVLEDNLSPLTLAYLPGLDGIDLRLTAWSLPEPEADHLLAKAAAQLKGAAGDVCYGEGDEDLAAAVLSRLREKGLQLATAESCTGGLLGGRITEIPGSSSVFRGGVVAYANEVKEMALDVPAALIHASGAVSEPVVRAMAEGAKRRFGVGAAMAVTGIAGPDGGTPDKPVGTVWLAASAATETRAVMRRYLGERDEVRRRAAQGALDLMRLLLKS
ncbi:MAG TPA: competence/damage-inducible protein A [Gemmatimonadales bacterium]|jgi:nicotinamide-nucleotide amidase